MGGREATTSNRALLTKDLGFLFVPILPKRQWRSQSPSLPTACLVTSPGGEPLSVSPQDLPCALGLGTLLALPGVLGSGGDTKDSAGSSSVTVVLLLLLLLLLVTGLALAWCRLSRDSGGYYHPARLGAALWGRTRRLLWASPPGRWLRAWAEPGSPDEDPEWQNEQDVENDYSLDGDRDEAEPRGEEQQSGEQPGPQQGPEPGQEAHDGDAEGGLGLSSQGPEGSAGSAEALLSDLHAFAGSAAWDDSARAAGGQGLHVTAL